MKTAIDHVLLLPMDGREPIPDACVFVDHDRVLYAGEKALAPLFSADESIDGRGGLCMPGLINTHTHLGMTLLRHVGCDKPLMEWLAGLSALEGNQTDEDIAVATKLAALECIRFGVTSVNDFYMVMQSVCPAWAESGLRGMFTGGNTTDPKVSNPNRHDFPPLYTAYNGYANDRIRFGLGLHAEYTSTPEKVALTRELAKEYSAPVHIHLSESAYEVAACKERHGVSPVRYFAESGLLDAPCTAAHCVHIDNDDIALLAEKKVLVSHNPISNLKLANGVSPVERLLHAGVRVGLGTDSTGSNDNLNLFEEIRFAAILHKGMSGDASAIPAKKAVAMATCDAAPFIGREDIGRLSPGCKADLIILDLDVPHACPLGDPYEHIAYSAQGSDVFLTMCDGETLYKDSEYRTLDKTEILEKARRIRERLKGGNS